MVPVERYAHMIRYYVVDMIQNLGFGHIGGALSCVDCLAVLYEPEKGLLKYDPKNPHLSDRDYFVLSKGHAGPALYATLAVSGFFDLKTLLTLNQPHTTLPSHVDRLKTPGVDMTAGSLGQGIGAAVGIACGARLNNNNQKVYCIVGDGELNEGQCWEAIQVAAHQKLNNLVVFIDNNKKQLDGKSNMICEPFNFVDKFTAFGWNTVEVDGHNHQAIYDAVQQGLTQEKPIAIVMNTTKGKGVEYLETIDDHHLRIDTDEKKEILQKARQYYADLAGIKG